VEVEVSSAGGGSSPENKSDDRLACRSAAAAGGPACSALSGHTAISLLPLAEVWSSAGDLFNSYPHEEEAAVF